MHRQNISIEKSVSTEANENNRLLVRWFSLHIISAKTIWKRKTKQFRKMNKIIFLWVLRQRRTEINEMTDNFHKKGLEHCVLKS